jgi:hypothetical protein
MVVLRSLYPEDFMDGADVVAGFEEACDDAVAEGVAVCADGARDADDDG